MGKEGLTFKALVVTVRPEVKLGEYKGLTAPRPRSPSLMRTSIGELKPFINRATRMVTVERAAENGDTVVIDFEGSWTASPSTAARPRATAWSWAPGPSSRL